MSADDSIEDLFVALRVLSKITANDKISTTSAMIALDNTWRGVQFLRRWWSGDKSGVNIDRARRVFGAMTLHVELKTELYEALTKIAPAAIKIDELRAFVTRALEALEAASLGVRNLCVTYRGDDNVCARIEELAHIVDTLVVSTRRRIGVGVVMSSAASSAAANAFVAASGRHPQQLQQHHQQVPRRHPVLDTDDDNDDN